jgi:hypothetical protein
MTQETSGKYAKQNAIDLSPAASSEELMVDTGGNRAGFLDAVVVELGSLKHHYNRVLFPIKIDVWEKIWSKMDQDT